MPTCNVCRYLVVDNSAQVCPNCGAKIIRQPVESEDNEPREPELSETPDQARESSSNPVIPRPKISDEDRLELCDPGEFIGAADDTSETEPAQSKSGSDSSSPASGESENADTSKIKAQAENLENTDEIKRLSAEQAAEIRSSFISPRQEDSEDAFETAAHIVVGHGRADNKPRRDDSEAPSTNLDATVRQMSDERDNEEEDKNEVIPPPEELPQFEEVHKSPAVRHVAYFHKNFIQLTGNKYPVSGDELAVGDQRYTLKPKKIKREHVAIAFSVLIAILLIIIGKQFISPTLPGKGTLVGIALDNSGRPVVSGTEISLPEAGKKTKTDSQGFFRFNDVGTGTYVIRCSGPGGLVVTDNISIVGDQVTTVTINLADAREEYSEAPPAGRKKQAPTSGTRSATNRKSSAQSVSSPAPSREKTGRQYSALKLQSNVDSPILYADGTTLGIGNLTYQKLLPGQHSIKVVKDGYQSWTGTIELEPDKIHTLNITLEKVKKTSKAKPTYSAEDFYQSGLAMLTDGNAKAAIDDLNEAIKLKSSMADAYAGRARANKLLGNDDLAVEDYILAGEIYSRQKRYETAHQMFDNALDVNDDSFAALTNKAELYRRQGDSERAADYYKKAISKDRENFQANFELGKLYFSMHKNKWADKYLQKAREVNPREPEVYHYLMLNYFAKDDFKEVKEVYADYKLLVNNDQLQEFKANPRYEPIIRIVGEYERP